MTDLQVKGRMVSFSKLTFGTSDPAAITKAVSQLTQGEDAYHGTLVLLDSTVDLDLAHVLKLVRDSGLQPFGVVDGMLAQQARALNIAVVPAEGPMQRIQPTQGTSTPAETPKLATSSTRAVPDTIYYDVLRTGQLLQADAGNLVITQDTNNGSEVISAGSIHVYGSANGRLIAGSQGDATARIFCQKLSADLVAIAGIYCVADDIPAKYQNKAVEISVSNDQELIFRHLSDNHG